MVQTKRSTMLQLAVLATLAAHAAVLTAAAQNGVDPLQKVVSLLGSLEMNIIRDGEAEQKAFDAFMDWCRNGGKDKEFEIKTAKSSIEDLSATIAKAESDISTLSSKIDDLGADIAKTDGDLKAATQIRDKENKDFVAVEAELTDTIDTLERAINILERKLHGSALLQNSVDRNDLGKLVQTLRTIVDAAALSLRDKQALIGLVQSSEQQREDADELGAPDPEAYKSRSESIIDVLEDLKQKAVTQLDEARKEETSAAHNFDLLKQSLEDEMKVDTKALSDSKISKHDASETKSTAEGDLAVTAKNLEETENELKNMKGDCMNRASDHETTVSNRAEELKALAAAKKAVLELTGGAATLVYNSTSFLQVDGNTEVSASSLSTREDLANFEVVNLVRKLAHEQKSDALAQLAVRISTVMRAGATSGSDPFKKVKALINDMLERLMKEAGEEAEHKAYCDKEYGETKTKTDELKYDVEKYSSKLEKAKSDSVSLKEEVLALNREVSEIVRSQGVADELRKKEYKVYVQSKADLEQGLSGVRVALKILRDYYASGTGAGAAAASLAQQPEDLPELHSKSTGGTGVIAMLEVVESDFGKSLASVEMTEEAAATAYEKLSMENKMSKAMKEQEREFKEKEAASLDKSSLDLTSDRDSAQTELDSVLQYSASLRSMCEVAPESYEERKSRREAEISGLREALQILEGEATFLQRKQPSGLRGSGVRTHRQ